MKRNIANYSGFNFSIKINIHDIWIGCYWKWDTEMYPFIDLNIYICLIPIFPIRLTFFFIKG
jgi:hypothetical protein